MRNATALLSIAALVAWTGACGSDAQKIPRQVSDFVSGVGSADGSATGALIQGAPPNPSGGPTPATPVGQGSVVNGGSTETTVSSDTVFEAVIVAVEGSDGYFRIQLADVVTEVALVLTFGQDIPEASFATSYALVDQAGLVGSFVSQQVQVTDVGTGDVQVSVAWDSIADLDLHVTDPNDFEISFLQRESPSGGSLDLDSNSGCTTSDTRIENVSWPAGAAPSGPYSAFVGQFSGCGATTTKYVLTIQRVGEDPLVFSGIYGEEAGDPSEHVYPFTFGSTEVECPDAVELGFTPGDPCGLDEECPGGFCLPGDPVGACVPLCDLTAPESCEQCGPNACVAGGPDGSGFCELGSAPQAAPYSFCDATTSCPDVNEVCSTAFLGGAFCAPACGVGGCPFPGEDTGARPQCGLDSTGGLEGETTHCILACSVPGAAGQCPTGMICSDDVGGAFCLWPPMP